MIDQGVTAALEARDALRSTNGDDSHNSGTDKIERYVGGLPDVIHESVVASRPKTMQEAIEMANELIDKRNKSWAECKAENKRKADDTFRSNQSQQQQNKRQNTGRVYTAASGEKKQYGGSKPLCAKCNYHHDETSESRTALQGQITALQAQVTALQAQVATLQGLARDSTHLEPPEETGGSA
nr:hypothetical protein [Tanacetum cinerariifolium]